MCLNYVQIRLNSHKLSDWYKVSRTEVSENGGQRLFNTYRSLAEALKTVYPDFNWEMEKFVKLRPVKKALWNDVNYQRTKLEKIGNELGIEQVHSHHKVLFQLNLIAALAVRLV